MRPLKLHAARVRQLLVREVARDPSGYLCYRLLATERLARPDPCASPYDSDLVAVKGAANAPLLTTDLVLFLSSGLVVMDAKWSGRPRTGG